MRDWEEAFHQTSLMFGSLKNLFRKKETSPKPFMEHPIGDFDSAVDAMEAAVTRLRQLPNWDRWITFSGQGQGGEVDSYEFFEVRMLGDKIDVGDKSLDIGRIVKAACANESSLATAGAHYSVAAASPREVAHLLDAIFRYHFGLRLHDDRTRDDYAVGAEW
jgi:hypothetical protein